MKHLTYRLILFGTFFTMLIPLFIQPCHSNELTFVVGPNSFQVESCWFQGSSLIRDMQIDCPESTDPIVIPLSEIELSELLSFLKYVHKQPDLAIIKDYSHKLPYQELLSLTKSVDFFHMKNLYDLLIPIAADRYPAEMGPVDVTNAAVTLIALPATIRFAITRKVLQNLYHKGK